MKLTNRIATIVLVVIMVVLLTACNEGTENEIATQSPSVAQTVQKTEPTQKPTQESTQAPTQAQSNLGNLVEDAVYEEIDDPLESQVYYYHIPKINLTNGLADEINKRMLADGEAFMNDAYESIDMGVSIISAGYNYLWGCKDNVVSVLVAKYYNMPGLDYKVYNLDVKTGKILSADDLGEVYGLSEQELTDLLIDKAAEKFEEKYQGMEDSWADFYSEQYSRTVDAENVEKSQLYIDKDGNLCSVTRIYSLAGAESYSHVLNLTGDTPAQDPDVTA